MAGDKKGEGSVSFLVSALGLWSGGWVGGVSVWIRGDWRLTRHPCVPGFCYALPCRQAARGLAELSLALHREVSKAPEEP